MSTVLIFLSQEFFSWRFAWTSDRRKQVCGQVVKVEEEKRRAWVQQQISEETGFFIQIK